MYHEISVKQAPRMAGTSSKSSEPDDGFRNALIKIVLTDLSMSLDNVLTMVGAAEG
jgi:predicted tellurium resistance membrane protein TerC